MDIIGWIIVWISGFLLIWFLVSPFICLYWLFRPPKWFWQKHKYISWAIRIGGFLGCNMIILQGIRYPIFLWFIPDDWMYKTGGEVTPVKLMVSGFISLVATLALFVGLWAKFGNYLIEKQQKDREARISSRISYRKYALQQMSIYEREEAFAELRRRKEELDKLKKKSPFQEEESIVLERLLLEQLLKESNKKQKKENNIFEELDEQEESL